MTVVPAGGKLLRSCPDGFGSRRWRCRVRALGGRGSGIEIENIRHGWSGYEQQAYPSLEARNSTMYVHIGTVQGVADICNVTTSTLNQIDMLLQLR